MNEDAHENCENHPVFAVFLPDDVASSPKTFYNTAKEAAKWANSPELKAKGARFRRFDSPVAAQHFIGSPLAVFRDNSPQLTGSDPAVPFKATTKIEMNRLKRFVELDQLSEFSQMVMGNPRYLVNTSGDCPAIAQEGFRYNVLHVAARSGAGLVTAKTLELCADPAFLSRLYGTDEADVLMRRDNIILGYLCTPDKGNVGTPLIMALKFGQTKVVRAIIDFMRLSVCEHLRPRLELNLSHLLDDAILCARYNGKESKEDVKNEIKKLFNTFYVPLYRSIDASAPAKILLPTDCPRLLITPHAGDCLPSASGSDLFSMAVNYKLAACAGPFLGEETAQAFQKDWARSGFKEKRSDMEKGFERVGRQLARKYGVEWREAWVFLETMCDVTTEEGLQLVDHYLRKMRLQPDESFGDSTQTEPRKQLFFAEEDDMEGAGDMPSENEDFCDAAEMFEEPDSEEPSPDDSLMGLTKRMDETAIEDEAMEFEDLALVSPVPDAGDEKMDDQESKSGIASLSDDEYDTPPPSPPPTYLFEEPTKLDNDLFLALNETPEERLGKFPQVSLFMRQMGRVEERARQCWPGVDSPRCPRTRSLQRLTKERRYTPKGTLDL
ncbi:unnamed protein product, partial [Mesorhabditis spiculigera]